MSITIPKPTKSLHRLFVTMSVVGILLILYSFFFLPFIRAQGDPVFAGPFLSEVKTINSTPEAAGGFHVQFLAPVNFFVTAILVLMIVWVVWRVALSVLYIDNPELVYFVIGGLVILFAILACIFSSAMAKSVTKAYQNARQFKLGIGPIAILIGGLLFGVGSAGGGLPTRE